MRLSARPVIVFVLVSLIGALLAVRGFNEQPGFTDAFYHYNSAARLASGEGFVDPYLWTYIGAPESLPAPSHLYWMPGTAIIAAAGMSLFGINFAAAQFGLWLCLWVASLTGFYLGWWLGGGWRQAWLAGLLTLIGGYFLQRWGTTDTFAPYAAVGSLCLVLIGQGLTASKRVWLWWLLAGVLAAFGHLIRNDGLLLLLVGVWALWYPPAVRHSPRLQQRFLYLVCFVAAYVLVMLPWFLRNLDAMGAILPAGGTQAIWYTGYDDLFSYPADASPATFFAGGVDLLLTTRWDALFGPNGALLTLIAVEGNIILAPLMLLAVWRKRRDAFLRAMIWFAIGVHVAFSLVFTFPGVRGGLFHAVAALVPWWAAAGIAGLDMAIDWMAKRRRTWNPRTAKPIFSVAVLVMVLVLSLTVSRVTGVYTPGLYPVLESALPDDARLMINDPAQLYYYTGFGGVVIPNESPEIILTIARQYEIDYLVLEFPNVPQPVIDGLEPLPDFLEPLDLNSGSARVYAIRR